MRLRELFTFVVAGAGAAVLVLWLLTAAWAMIKLF
jgi:hypothetical protein